jgi:hypothetical protein
MSARWYGGICPSEGLEQAERLKRIASIAKKRESLVLRARRVHEETVEGFRREDLILIQRGGLYSGNVQTEQVSRRHLTAHSAEKNRLRV